MLNSLDCLRKMTKTCIRFRMQEQIGQVCHINLYNETFTIVPFKAISKGTAACQQGEIQVSPLFIAEGVFSQSHNKVSHDSFLLVPFEAFLRTTIVLY